MFVVFLVLLIYSSVSLAVTNEEIINGYDQLEKQITPHENALRFYSNNINSREDIPKFIQYLKDNTTDNPRDYDNSFMKLLDFGKNLTATNFFKSIEYQYILKHFSPKCDSSSDTNHFQFRAFYIPERFRYPRPYIFRQKFPMHCQYHETITKRKSLGWFEGPSNADYKNVTYDVYTCRPSQSDVKLIQEFERRFKTDDFSKTLAKAPMKYVVKNTTYHYRPASSSPEMSPAYSQCWRDCEEKYDAYKSGCNGLSRKAFGGYAFSSHCKCTDEAYSFKTKCEAECYRRYN
jgi:hypothetical protein